ncbi:MAG: DUF342 domain-containing protein [Deltaproteobacteria bacterium]|nr:DUF342 domain-containing protein [Deltaproteobacteria bacterium]MBW2014658.1 DUF342 domain-containing protein [Deltaproteobacteria bacterium]MBW2087935.1 DUF342 domain-containing protein [Deltaproteobacteria bacterium]
MQHTTVTISAGNNKTARIQGARQLGVQPDEVKVVPVDEKTYSVSIKNMPGQFEITVQEDKMVAVIETITPPLDNGKPVTVEDIEHALADLGIIFGINKEVIKNIVCEVVDTGTPRNNIQVAAGEPAKAGNDGRIDFKIGRGAVNKDPNANTMVKPGQIIAVRISAGKGTPGKNIFGEEVPSIRGNEVDFAPGDHVTVSEDGNTFIAEIYGAAKLTPKKVWVENLVKVSTSGMWAKLSIFPTLADNSQLAYQDVYAALEQSGVISGIKEDSIKKAIEAGEPIRDFMVAEANPAKDGVNARIDFKFRLNGDDPEIVDAARHDGSLPAPSVIKEMFWPGDVIAVKIPQEKPFHGSTIFGKTLTGAEPKDKQIKAGTNVTVLDDGVTFVVADGISAGYADYLDGQLCVQEPLHVSEDKLTVFLSVHPPSRSGRMMTVDLVEKLLAGRGIVQGIDRNAIEQALNEAVSKNVPVHDVVIAKGRAAQRGEDGQIELKFQPEKIAGTVDEISGKIDYKERKSIQKVKAGTLLAVKIPATPGIAGVDVFGDIIPAEPGNEKDLTPAGNVKVSDDGRSFTSEIDGIVFLSPENKIWISKEHEVPGDVDYSVGNLSMEGSLDIKGWIQSGFEVRASDEIRVGGGIEDAIVEAGADININGGIIGSGGGSVQAGGKVTARFFEGARVHADGDIIVRDDILRSTVSTNGSIIVTQGKGRIRGGSVEAVKGVEVNEIGSDAGVETYMSVGMDSKTRKLLADSKKQLKHFEREKAKMDKILARSIKKYKHKKLSGEINRKLVKLVKHRREVLRKETMLTKFRRELVQKISKNGTEPVTVKVIKAVYSGTKIDIGGYVYRGQEDIRGKTMFVLNAEQKAVELVV